MLAAYNTESGSMTWSYKFISNNSIQNIPQFLVHSGNYAFVSSRIIQSSKHFNKIQKFDLRTGLPTASIILSGVSAISNMSAAPSKLLVAGSGKDFYVIDSNLAEIEAYESETTYNYTSLRKADSFLFGGKTPAFGYQNISNTTYDILWADEIGFQGSSLSLEQPIPSWSNSFNLSNSNKSLVFQSQKLLLISSDKSPGSSTALRVKESQGVVDLLTGTDDLAFAKENSGNTLPITWEGKQIGDKTWLDLSIVAAETINEQNQFVTQHALSGDLSVFSADGSWAGQSNTGLSYNSTDYLTAENSFGIDFNNNGIIGG